jgi:hypothetical protein
LLFCPVILAAPHLFSYLCVFVLDMLAVVLPIILAVQVLPVGAEVDLSVESFLMASARHLSTSRSVMTHSSLKKRMCEPRLVQKSC